MKKDNFEEDKTIKEIKKKKMEEIMKKISEQEEYKYLDKPVIVNEKNFNEFISKYPNVMIDCWAEWCGPCRMVAPIIDELAKEYRGRVVFGKLNTDENSRLAMKFGITAIPTFLFFKDGKKVDTMIGALPKEAFEQRLKKVFILS
ncbi:MAG: thioredoxin [Candidatus Methanoliparum thermophilum]|uniref:Thioredoxin n=1 Tax=Methanoliparum thermophilum TaxID=2491083 RepID=A0A520KRX4_METT2|nr:thioredoxin [Candidatus Methanoliparum sp. LAM-1]RZN64541.1 MAG: thioredoxin [Candidatus Methanoliparum thermophilum]BDC35861.1 thiol reductase thioredoxin [Candidatus Methanoliparum sp. LAM-1]